MEKRFLEEVERVVERLTEADIEKLMHQLDHCLLMANKFRETRRPEHYARMEDSCRRFTKLLEEFRRK